MVFHGMQKLTLLDYPSKLACTLFTQGCNFRCPFCQNGELIGAEKTFEEFSEEEVLAFLQKRAGVLDGVCVTGGEPLLHDLTAFLTKVKAMGYAVKLDTNGYFPTRLKSLVDAKLVDYVAMDIKSGKSGYAEASGFTGSLSPIEQSVSYLKSGAVEYEFRTTVVRELHTNRDFVEIADWLDGATRYFLQGFVDSEFVLEKGLTGYNRTELEAFCSILRTKIPSVEIRGVD